MPLMQPNIQALLREAGIDKTAHNPTATPLEEKLERAGLSLDDTLDKLSDIVNGTSNDSLKLQALRDVFRLHNVGQTAAPVQVPNFTIVINDNKESPAVQGVNPIFLPRQLLAVLPNPNKELAS